MTMKLKDIQRDNDLMTGELTRWIRPVEQDSVPSQRNIVREIET